MLSYRPESNEWALWCPARRASNGTMRKSVLHATIKVRCDIRHARAHGGGVSLCFAGAREPGRGQLLSYFFLVPLQATADGLLPRGQATCSAAAVRTARERHVSLVNPVLLSILTDSLARSSIKHLRVNSRCLYK